jgi:hypothetical protein
VLLGNIGVNDELRDLPELQAVAGGIFFWTYQLLVSVWLPMPIEPECGHLCHAAAPA